jgi:UDP-sulfoquinovose synthase
MQNRADNGELRIFNQIMETFSANELADKVKAVGDKRGHDVEIKSIDNPRKEAEEHYYNPVYQGLLEIGVEPHYLTEEVLANFYGVVEEHKSNVRKDVIFKGVKWD